MRRSQHEAMVRKVAAEFGANIIAVGTTGGGHRYAVITRAGKRRKVFFSATPSDYRADRNLVSTVRRVVRSMAATDRVIS